MVQVELQLPSVSPAEFNYLRPLPLYDIARPYRLQFPHDLIPMPSTNVSTQSYPVQIYNMAGHEDRFQLDVSGFQFFKCPVDVGDWNDRSITESYLPALVDWVVPLLGGTSGLVYSFNVSLSSDTFRVLLTELVSSSLQRFHRAGAAGQVWCRERTRSGAAVEQ